VYFQALIAPAGPGGRCLDAASNDDLTLFLSEYIVAELRDVCLRPKIAAKFDISLARLDDYEARLKSCSTLVDDVPHVFSYERDPKDEHYVDLAIATNSELVVSRDKDLLALADSEDPVARDFRTRFPEIKIITPVDLLEKLDTR
ncbi:MAG: putative toxin-antitoxin system toxin component, PIN family, partial [Aeoliella sp.]